MTLPALIPFIAQVLFNVAVAAIVSYAMRPDEAETETGITQAVKKSAEDRNIVYGRSLVGGVIVFQNTSGGLHSPYLTTIIVVANHPVEDIEGFWLNEEYIDIHGEDHNQNDLDANYYISTADKEYGHNEFEGLTKVVKVTGWGFANSDYVSTSALSFNKVTEDKARLSQIFAVPGWTFPVGLDRDLNGAKLTNCAFLWIQHKYVEGVWSGFPNIKGILVKGKRLFDPSKCYDSALGIYGSGTHDINDPTTWEWSENWALACLDYLKDTKYGLSASLSEEIDWDSFIVASQDSAELIPNGYDTPHNALVPRYTVNGNIYTGNTPISNFESLLSSGAGTLIYKQGKYSLRAGVYRAPESFDDIITESDLSGPIQIRTATPRSEIFNKVSAVYTQAYDDSIPPLPVFETTDMPLVNPLTTAGINVYEFIDGEEIIKELDFPFCIYPYEAQRLARIALERVRQGQVYRIECNLSTLRYSVGDVVYLSIFNDDIYNNDVYDLTARLGLTDTVQSVGPNVPPSVPSGVSTYYKQYKIINMEYNPERENIAIELVEEAPEIYDWNEGYAYRIDYAPNADFGGMSTTEALLPPTWVLPTGYENISVSSLSTTVGNQLLIGLYWAGAQSDGTKNSGLDRGFTLEYEIEYGIVTDPSAVLPIDTVTQWLKGPIHPQTDHIPTEGIVQGPANINISSLAGISYNFRVRGRSRSKASTWAYYSQEIGSFFELATSGTTSLIPEPPEAILVEKRPNTQRFNVAVDVGTTFNISVTDLDYVELIQCSPSRNPGDHYADAYLRGGSYERIIGYKKSINNITADNNWVLFEDLTAMTGWSNVRGNFVTRNYFWARIWTKSGNVSGWYPSTLVNKEGVGPFHPNNMVDDPNPGSVDNLIDPETGEIINLVDGAGPGAGPVGDFTDIVSGGGWLSAILRHLYENATIVDLKETSTSAGVFESTWSQSERHAN